MNTLRQLFDAANHGDTITIPPGEYHWNGEISLKSGTRVIADGAVFRFPEILPTAHIRMFTGSDLRDFSWQGGTFCGYVYDPAAERNLWEPNAETVAIAIEGGENLAFSHIRGDHLAGPAVSVCGTKDTPVKQVTVTHLQTELCGKFMWDYGYLWQRITFPEYHSVPEVKNAYCHMPAHLYSDPLTFDGELISSSRLPARQLHDDAVTFFGSKLPPELTKGKYYYAEEQDNGLIIREKLSDKPIRFTPGDYDCRMFRGIYQVYHAMYAPAGSGGSKGSLDLRFVDTLRVTGCSISAPGDATHFHHCRNGEIRGNILSGARMGAMFLSSGCENMQVRENIVNGGNGSRVLTVETGGTNVLIEGNIFRGGGRGTWIDTPHGITLRGNLFDRNTCKSTPDPAVGRISPTDGTFERFAEIYFTTRQPGAVYGDIILEDNLIRTGDGCTAALAFNAHGQNIRVEGNTFTGPSRDIYVSSACEEVAICGNYGGPAMRAAIARESFDIPGTIYLPDGMRK